MSAAEDRPSVTTVAVAGPHDGVEAYLTALSDIPLLSTTRWQADPSGEGRAAWSGFGRLRVGDRAIHLIGTESCAQGEFLRSALAVGLLGMILLVDPAEPARAGRELDSFGRIADVPFTVGVLSRTDTTGGGTGPGAAGTAEIFADTNVPDRLTAAGATPVDPVDPDAARGLLMALLEATRIRLADAETAPVSRTGATQ